MHLESSIDPVLRFGEGSRVPMSSYESHSSLAQSQGDVGLAAPTVKPRVRARRGQATDPHSIAERVRRERIAERMKALQELVPNSNKTDKASMLDEIIEYAKFLQLQVKVLSMSRLGGAAAVAPLVADLPAEGKNSLAAAVLGQNTGFPQHAMVTAEQEVASLMEEDMGSAMQFLQSKGLCLMPISLAAVISSTSDVRPSSAGQAEQGGPSTEQLQMGPYSSFLLREMGHPGANFMMPSATGGF